MLALFFYRPLPLVPLPPTPTLNPTQDSSINSAGHLLTKLLNDAFNWDYWPPDKGGSKRSGEMGDR